MKRLTESQLRQVIREELIGLLNEISPYERGPIYGSPEARAKAEKEIQQERSKGKKIGTITFEQLKTTQKELGDDPSKVRGEDFSSTTGTFAPLNAEGNAKYTKNIPVDLYYSKQTGYVVYVNPEGSGVQEPYTVSTMLGQVLTKLIESPPEEPTTQAVTEPTNMFDKLKGRIGALRTKIGFEE